MNIEAKEEHLLKFSIEDFVGDNQLLKGVNIDGSQDKEGWLIFDAERENDEDCVGFLGEVSREMEYFWCELSLLEKRPLNHRMSIQTVKLELNKK